MTKSKDGFIASAVAVAVLSLGIVALSMGNVYAQTSDFFSNTQSTDKRAGTGGAIAAPGSIAANNPGFNPCSGATVPAASRTAAGGCSGTVDATSLLSPNNLDTIFQQAGPGAITDNMFGKVTAVLGTPATFTDCGATAGNINTVALADVLNCGNVRITPETQGMNIPTFPATNSLSSLLSGNANQNGDFCADAATDCPNDSVFPATPVTQTVSAHMGLNLINSFEWNPGAAIAGVCGASGAGGADQPNFCSDQIMEQVTALNTTGIGTLTAPGSNDQRVRIETNFEVITSNTLATMPAPFNVSIAVSISDPDMTGGTGTGFTQTIGTVGSGSTFGTPGMTFSHNVDDGGAPTALNQEFTCVAPGAGNFAVGCSQYPSGPTQTVGDINADLP